MFTKKDVWDVNSYYMSCNLVYMNVSSGNNGGAALGGPISSFCRIAGCGLPKREAPRHLHRYIASKIADLQPCLKD